MKKILTGLLFFLTFFIWQAKAQAPSNDTCAGAITLPLDTTCNNVVANNSDATDSGVGDPGCANYQGGDIWYTFTIPSNFTFNQYIILKTSNVPGSSVLDTGMALYTGSCGNLSLVECNDDGPSGSGYYSQITIMSSSPGTVYYVRLWTYNNGQVGDFNICARMIDGPVNNFCAHAENLTVYPSGGGTGNETSATVATASDSGQHPSCDNIGNLDLWYSFTAPTSGVVKVITSGNSGNDVKAAVYDSCGGTELICFSTGSTEKIIPYLTPGQNYILQVWLENFSYYQDFDIVLEEAPTPPVNDFCSGAITLPLNSTFTHVAATNQGATDSGVAVPACGTYQPNDVWFTFTTPSTLTADQAIIIKTCPPTGSTGNANNSTGIALYSGDCNNLTPIDCRTTGGQYSHAYMAFTTATASTTYYVRIWTNGYYLQTGNFDVCSKLVDLPPNNDCANAETLTVYPQGNGAGNETAASTTDAIDSGQHPSCDNYGRNSDLWYTFTAPSTGVVKMTTDGATGDYIKAAIYDSCGGTELNCRSNGNEKVFSGLTPGQNYILQVLQDYYNIGDFTIVLEAGDMPPSNDFCSGAINIPVSSTCNYIVANNQGATDSGEGNVGCSNNTPVNDIWFSFTVPSNIATDQPIIIKTDAANGSNVTDTGLSGFSGNCNNLNEISCVNTVGDFSRLVFRNLTPGEVYFVKAWAEDNQQGNFNICAQMVDPPANNDCANAVPLTVYPQGNGAGNEISGSTLGATDSGQHSTTCPSGYYWDVWYSFTAPASGNIAVITGGEAGSTLNAAIYDSCGGSEVACSHGVPINFHGLTPGQSYVLQLYSFSDLYIGDFSVVVEEVPYVYPSLSLTTNPDCNNNQFFVDLNVTALGGSSSITISDDQGNAPQQISAPGTLTFGPYNSGVSVTFTVTSDDDPSLVRYYVEEYFCPPSNDNCTGALPLTVNNTCTPVVATNAGSTDSGIPAPNCGNYIGGDVWFTVVVPADGNATIETSYYGNSSITDTVLAVYEGDCNNLTEIACNDDIGYGNFFSRLDLTGRTAGETIYVRAFAYDGIPHDDFNICAYNPNVGITGIDKIDFFFYPNPISNKISWKTNGNIEKIQITNLTGQIIMEVQNPADNYLNTGKMKPGMYLLRVFINGKQGVYKIIKE